MVGEGSMRPCAVRGFVATCSHRDPRVVSEDKIPWPLVAQTSVRRLARPCRSGPATGRGTHPSRPSAWACRAGDPSAAQQANEVAGSPPCIQLGIWRCLFGRQPGPDATDFLATRAETRKNGPIARLARAGAVQSSRSVQWKLARDDSLRRLTAVSVSRAECDRTGDQGSGGRRGRPPQGRWPLVSVPSQSRPRTSDDRPGRRIP
jgi:hypothetical protein